MPVPANCPAYTHAMPDAARYGVLGDIAPTLQSPLGPAYVSLLALYAGQGVNITQGSPNPRPTLYALLLGNGGAGKSLVVDRARQALFYDYDRLLECTAASDRGVLALFRQGLDRKDAPPAVPTPGVLVVDEMIAMLKKMAIEGSSLRNTLNTLYIRDRYSVADKHGECAINARVSLLGNLTLDDPSEFGERFGSDSKDGFLSRLILAPFPSDWRWERQWSPTPLTKTIPCFFDDEPLARQETSTNPLLPTGAVSFSPARHAEVDEWEDKWRDQGVNPGRCLEIAMRVAVITASANGDVEVTEEGLAAALAFAEWQMAIRGAYSAGDGRNPDAVVTGVLLDAIEVAFAADKAGTPLTTGYRPVVEGGWVVLPRLVKLRNFSRKYGSVLTRIVDSLVRVGTLEELVIETKGEKPRRTGKYRLPELEGEAFDDVELPTVPVTKKEAA